MHVDDASRQYTTAGGERRTTRCVLLRRSYRDADGKPHNETLANLSALPPETIEVLRKSLKGAVLIDAEAGFEVERSVPHGDAAAAHIMAGKLGIRSLLGPPCPERDIAYALILARMIRPASKLSTVRWWAANNTTMAALAVKALYELRRTGGTYALVTMWIGGGQGIAAVFERM